MKYVLKFAFVLVLLAAAGLGIRALVSWGDARVDRAVFEESYQRSESIRARVATDEAVLVEIEARLAGGDLDDDTRKNLKAQARAARVRIRAAKNMRGR